MRRALQYFSIAMLMLLSFAAIAQKGEIVYQKGAFLKQLQERDSILIADHVLTRTLSRMLTTLKQICKVFSVV